MITDFELMNIHVRALFTHDSESRLLVVNEPGGTNLQAARMFLGRTRSGNIWRFRADLPENLCGELAEFCAEEPIVEDFREPPRYAADYVRLLKLHALVRKTWAGPAYQFTENAEQSKNVVIVTEENADVLHDGFEDFVAELPDWQPFVALVQNNRAVSVCRSARITMEAHEAGVETLSNFRGKGYAEIVTVEWARLVRKTGAMPLYSTCWENVASQAVARKLNLRCYGADFHIF